MHYRFTPSIGSHVFTVSAYAQPNTPGPPEVYAVAGGSGSTVPAYARFTKV